MVRRFNPPPGWPEPPPGWLPAEDFVPDPSWPDPPEGWQLVIDDGEPVGRWRAAANRVLAQGPGDDPETIWSAESQTLTSAATGGKAITGRYRLTSEMPYFERGLLRTDAQQVPIVDVIDVDVSQSLTQKARSVGNVVVHIQRTNGIETVTMESIPHCRDAQAIINRTAREARHLHQQRQNTMRYETASRPPWSAPTDHQPEGSSHNGHDSIAQLRELGALRDAGILSDEEFQEKKTEILRRM
jgi:hypothetical protein